jgi:2,4-dienoyl-CoA reductase-like NADH-dependent reductase (Old Yellow Enzyme family)
LQTDLADAGIAARHDLVDVTSPDVLALLAERGLDVVSMGRPAADDPALFLAAGAAGALAAERAR